MAHVFKRSDAKHRFFFLPKNKSNFLYKIYNNKKLCIDDTCAYYQIDNVKNEARRGVQCFGSYAKTLFWRKQKFYNDWRLNNILRGFLNS